MPDITFEYSSNVVIRKRRTRVALEVILPEEHVEEILKQYPGFQGYYPTVYLWLRPKEVENTSESYRFDPDYSFEESDDPRTWQNFAD